MKIVALLSGTLAAGLIIVLDEVPLNMVWLARAMGHRFRSLAVA